MPNFKGTVNPSAQKRYEYYFFQFKNFEFSDLSHNLNIYTYILYSILFVLVFSLFGRVFLNYYHYQQWNHTIEASSFFQAKKILTNPHDLGSIQKWKYSFLKEELIVSLKSISFEEITKIYQGFNSYNSHYLRYMYKQMYQFLFSKANYLKMEAFKADNISNSNFTKKSLTKYKGFISYKIKNGDYLGTIASKFKTTVKNLIMANPKIIKNPNFIISGMHILIPINKGN